MDRVLELNEPITISLAQAEIGAAMPSGSDGEAYLIQQLSAGVWGYMLDGKLCLVSRSLTALACLVPGQHAGILQVESIAATEQKDVTAAFKDGCKIVADWIPAGQNPSNTGNGAGLLWAKLSGQAQTNVQSLPITPNQAARQAEPMRGGEGLPYAANTEYIRAPSFPAQERLDTVDRQAPDSAPILPQSEIDRLIASMRENRTPPPAPITTETATSATDVNQPLPPLSPDAPAAEEDTGSNWLGSLSSASGADTPAPMVENELPRLDFGAGGWTSVPGQETLLGGPSAGEKSSAVTNPGMSLLDLVAGHCYAVVIFERRDEFERALEIARQGFNGSLIALWEKQPVHTRLTAGLQGQLEIYQSKYRSAAAKMQKELTRLRQLDQIIPNLHTHQQQRSRLAAEAARIAEQMQTIRWRQIVQNHDGRGIARKIFDLEAKRRAVLGNLAVCTHRLLRRSTPKKLLSGSSFLRTRARFLALQRQLEGCFERLAILEKELQRRLEYQAEWQALVKQQVSVERELTEIEKYLKGIAIGAPGNGLPDAKAAQKWLAAEWETARLRERFLFSWQEHLLEERGWIVRPRHEPLLVLGDALTMSLTGVGRGAFFVLVTGEHAEAMPKAPDECEGWVMTDSSLKMIDSGTGFGYTGDPLAAAIRNLADEMGLDMENALQTLDLADQVGEMENQGGNFNV